MNKTKIEWVSGPNSKPGYSWNPVTGCLHGCDYCYAEKFTKRFGAHWKSTASIELLDSPYMENGVFIPYPYDFKPTFHKYRIDEPKEKKDSQNIFVCSMADLFGDWVPKSWIECILNTIEVCPQHTFMLLTKNPIRYRHFNFPQNCWLGTTVTTQEEVERIIILNEVSRVHENKTFVSFEPLHSFIDLTGVPYFDWTIVGVQTGISAKLTEPEWVQSIIGQCRDVNIPLFIKDNVKWPMRIQEYPWQSSSRE